MNRPPRRNDESGLRAWSHMLGAHALAVRSVEARLRSAGQPSLAWYDVLLELDRAEGRLRIGELGRRIVVEPYNLTRLIDRLEEKKLIRRETPASDRRGALVVLTKDGRVLRRKMWPHYRHAILDVFGQALSEPEANALVRAFKKVIARLRSDGSDSGT